MRNETQYKVVAYEDSNDIFPAAKDRFEDEKTAIHQKALWEREGAEVSITEVSAKLEAHEEDECLLCAPAPHQNCEVYAVIQMLDPEKVPLGEDCKDHLVSVPVCLEHYQAFEKYQQGKNVAEVRV